MRSILFLPTDKIERLPKAIGSGADKVIFDLEDGLAHDKKAVGRSNFAVLSYRNYDGLSHKLFLRFLTSAVPFLIFRNLRCND